MNRKITLAYHDNFLDAVAEFRPRLHQGAIGYFSSWAMDNERYSGECTIYCGREGNISATYRDKQGNVTYNMAAEMRDDGTYSFHS